MALLPTNAEHTSIRNMLLHKFINLSSMLIRAYGIDCSFWYNQTLNIPDNRLKCNFSNYNAS